MINKMYNRLVAWCLDHPSAPVLFVLALVDKTLGRLLHWDRRVSRWFGIVRPAPTKITITQVLCGRPQGETSYWH